MPYNLQTLMLSITKLKYIKSLHRKKYRQKYNKIIVEGFKICSELIEQKLIEIDSIYITNAVDKSLISVDGETALFEIPINEMKSISLLQNPSPILLICNMPFSNWEINATQKLLYLDRIQDPGNLGTIIRTADWFAFDGIVLSEDSVESTNPKVIQASMGSVFRIPIKVIPIEELKESCSKLKVIAADMHGISINKYIFPQHFLLILGNEGQGIHPDLAPLIEDKILIPQNGDRNIESLNVAVAASIFMSASTNQGI